MNTEGVKYTGCCDLFDPALWQDKEIFWDKKLFVRDHLTCFLHVPLNMRQKVVDNMEKIKKAGANSSMQLMLTLEKTLWSSDIYINVAREVPGASMEALSGNFLTKVFEGPYENVGKWAKEMDEYVRLKNKNLKKLYFSYTTCPACAEAYGKNYVVLFAEV